ncbi:hypothetical protein NM208_g4905 [Fusarium decemcellulare]|uniref:Uncharacterized protein n=1 Tax=Fusarium decemcellulare TaxID=57161 RepID=A0ACC1SJ61_9HYPO|nr:hypothetical protein NM208_g4905 [Fusarium decemcellulare]
MLDQNYKAGDAAIAIQAAAVAVAPQARWDAPRSGTLARLVENDPGYKAVTDKQLEELKKENEELRKNIQDLNGRIYTLEMHLASIVGQATMAECPLAPVAGYGSGNYFGLQYPEPPV